MKVGVTLDKYVLAPLATMASAYAIDGAIQRKMHGRAAVRAGKGITLIISSHNIHDIWMKI